VIFYEQKSNKLIFVTCEKFLKKIYFGAIALSNRTVVTFLQFKNNRLDKVLNAFEKE